MDDEFDQNQEPEDLDEEEKEPSLVEQTREKVEDEARSWAKEEATKRIKSKLGGSAKNVAQKGAQTTGKVARGGFNAAKGGFNAASTGAKAAGKATGAATKAAGQAIATSARAAGQAIIAASQAIWAAIAPYALPIIGIIIALILIVWGTVYFYRYFKGYGGISKPDHYVSATSSSDISSIKELLGESNMIPGDPTSWYFSQADPKFNKKKLNGTWPSGRSMLRQAGCAITSATMMIRIYGVKDVTPVDYANRNAKTMGGSLKLNKGLIATYINEHYEKTGNSRRVKVIRVPTNLNTIKKYIANGDPILTQGEVAFGGAGKPNSGGQHWVVIIGVSKDNKWLVISDPASMTSSGKRGSPARFADAKQLKNGRIKNLYVVVDR